MILNRDTLSQLQSLLGVDFISYCMATAKDDVSACLREESQLLPGSELALETLADLCGKAVQHSIEKQVPTDLLWDVFGIFDAAESLSLANAIRKQAGGQIFEPQHADPLVETLQRIAVSVYPLLLIIPSGVLPRSHVSLTRPLISYPISSLAVDEVLKDVDLSRLHPGYRPQGDDQDEDDPSQALRDLAVYRTVETIILFAFNKAKFTLLAVPSVEQVCHGIPDSVSTAKRLIQGKSVLLPVSIGLSNIKLPPGTVITSELGRLSEYLHIYDSWLPASLRGIQTSLHSDQGLHEFNRGGDIVLHMEQKSRLRMQSGSGDESYLWQLSAVDASVPTGQSIICLAITLAVDYETPLAVSPMWSAGFAPVTEPMISSRRVAQEAGPQPTIAPLRVISVEESQAWNEWISRIHTTGFKGVEVAARRIQLAIAERDNPVDRFVDSIIAWENLFGGDTELTFRISCSLAWLLGENPDHRRQVQKEASGLYVLRGKVVHGKKHLSDSDASASAVAGLRMAIEALRKIYTEKPQMIKADATERSLSMILQSGPLVVVQPEGIAGTRSTNA